MRRRSQVQRVKLALLVLDYNLYPRHKVDQYHVRSMVATLEAGRSLPPILVDAKTMRVVDGFHRFEAYKKFLGADGEISVIMREYPSEAAVLLEAIALNATHGRALHPFDKARCLILAENLHIEAVKIAGALSITVDRLEEIRHAKTAIFGQEPVAIKHTLSHYAGEELTELQAGYNIKAGGMNQLFYVNQVIAMLEASTVDWANERLVAGLKKLAGLLETALTTKV